MNHDKQRYWTADVRRRLRAKAGPSTHALRTTAEAFRQRGKYISGSFIVLIGFDEVRSHGAAAEEAQRIEDTLVRYGARVHVITAAHMSGDEFRKEFFKRAQGADALLIDTDSRHFRSFRPREIRERGPDIVIPTTLRA